MLVPLATLVVACLQAPAPRLERDVLYRTVDGVELRLDVSLPPGSGPHPGVVLLHGGAWMHGARGDVREVAAALSARGFACFAPSYRLAPAHRYPAQIEDCQYAVQFLRAHAARFELDPAHLGALGFSAGGHLAALLGVLDERADPHGADPVLRQSSRVQCVVSYFGPVLLTRTKERDFDTQPPPELFGDAPDSAYAAASPLLLATKDDAPFLLVHGEADTVVPVDHSALLEEKLRALGVGCELVVLPGAGHGDFLVRDPFGDYWKRTEAFLATHLALAQAR